MLLNLSGAHGPFFTRNVVLLQDNAGRTGAGEVPGGRFIIEQHELAAEARGVGLGHPQRKRHRDGGVDGIAAGFKHSNSGLGRLRVAGDHHAVPAQDGRDGHRHLGSEGPGQDQQH